MTNFFVITVKGPPNHLLCKRPGWYHCSSKIYVRDWVFKLSPIYASLIHQIPWFYWIPAPFRENPTDILFILISCPWNKSTSQRRGLKIWSSKSERPNEWDDSPYMYSSINFDMLVIFHITMQNPILKMPFSQLWNTVTLGLHLFCRCMNFCVVLKQVLVVTFKRGMKTKHSLLYLFTF